VAYRERVTIVSLRDQILASDDIPTELVEVPEWGVIIEVRGMNGADRARIIEAASLADGRMGVGSMYAETVITACYDPETGEKVFAPEDLGPLMAKSASAIDRLASVGMRLSGMSPEAQDDAGRRFPEEPSPEDAV
jgi:hypothetical protein